MPALAPGYTHSTIHKATDEKAKETVNAEKTQGNLKAGNGGPEQKNQEATYNLDFTLPTIKRKYIKDCDSKNLRHTETKSTLIRDRTSKSMTGDIGDSPYIFPFNKNKLTTVILEELQKPFDVSLAEITNINNEFLEKFPFAHIPMYVYESAMDNKKAMLDISHRSDDSKDGMNNNELGVIQEQYQHSCSKFDMKDIQRLKETLVSEEVKRIAGLLCHFMYWIVFG